MADRTVLHVDMNCFYASVEMLHRPQMRHVPMAVGGDHRRDMESTSLESIWA